MQGWQVYRRLTRNSITKKLMILYLIVIFIPLSIGLILLISNISNSVRTDYLNSVMNNLNQINYSVTEKVIIAIQVGKSIANDKKIQIFLNSNNLPDREIVETINNYITTSLRSALIQNPDVYRIQILHANSGIFDQENVLIYDSELHGQEWNNKLDNLLQLPKLGNIKYNKILLDLPHLEDIYDTRTVKSTQNKSIMNSRKKVWSLYFPIYYDYSYSSDIGLVQIDILEDTLLEPTQNVVIKEGDFVASIDAGSLEFQYYSNKNINLPQALNINNIDNFTHVKLNNKSFYMVKVYNQYLSHWYTQFVSTESLMNWKDYRTFLVLWISIMVVTLSGIIWFMSRGMLYKFLLLTKAINSIKQGNFETTVHISSNDEIGELACNFNEMTDKIRILMSDIQKANHAEKEAIYRALENQIRPHFLCNALDMVRMSAKTRGESDISRAIETITNYFMYNLVQRNKYVTLDVELKNVTDYINMHNMMRNNLIMLDIRLTEVMDTGLNKLEILKFTLQPLIENCIKHGFKEKISNCNIYVTINVERNTYTICIEDNGKGISEQRMIELDSLLSYSNKEDLSLDTPTGIGLLNVKERIVMNYGKEADLKIESYEGVGTIITLNIPRKHIIS